MRYNRSTRACRAACLHQQQHLFYSSKLCLLVKFSASHIDLLVSSQSSQPILVSITIPIGQELFAPSCFLLASLALFVLFF